MKKFILLPVLMLACVFLTGCFGLVVAHPRQKSSPQFCLGSRGTLTNGPAMTSLTETRLLELWGRPDATWTNNEAFTVWHYDGKRMWSWVAPAYVVILPIPIPSSHSQTDIYFKDGRAQKAQGQVMVLSGAMIGMPGPFVLAVEKEPEDRSGGVCIGYGFSEDAKAPPAQK